MNTEIGATQYEVKRNAFSGIIKIVGVGGCGGNAVNSMYSSQMIDGVSYLLINTDQQDLDKSSVSHKLTIGPTTTKGEGAGNTPSNSIAAAQESKQDIIEAITSDGARMLFVIAGLGGGTGTGAGPLICQYAREAGLLVVGVVTLPWAYEGVNKRHRAIEALMQVKQNVDSLLIINNEKISQHYSTLGVSLAKQKTNEEILGAVKSISDMLVNTEDENVDFADIRTTLKNGSISIIKSGYGIGENRLEQALEEAINTPILNGFDIEQSTKILIHLTSSPVNECTFKERGRLSEMTKRIRRNYDLIAGYSTDKTLEDGQVKVSILATGLDFLDSEEEDLKSLSELSLREDQERRKNLNIKEELLYGEEIREMRPDLKSYFLLNIADLENELLLEAMERTPVHQRSDRDYEILERLREHTTPRKADTFLGFQPSLRSSKHTESRGKTTITGFDQ